MKLMPILLLSLAFAAGAGAPQAHATLLVRNSTFTLTLDNTAGTTQSQLITANGLPDTFLYGSVPVSVTVTDTPIGGGAETIAIIISASQDLFPSSTLGAGSWYLGTSPLQLSEPVTLTSALMTATIPPLGRALFPSTTISLATSPIPHRGTGSFSGMDIWVVSSTRRDTIFRRSSLT